MKNFFNIIKRFFALRKERKQRKKMAAMKSTFIVKPDSFNSDVLDTQLVDENTSTKTRKKIVQFTKIIVSFLTIMTCIWISFSYYLAWYAVETFQDTETLEELSKQVCTTILGVVIAYACKSLLESWSEGKQKLAEASLLLNEQPIITDEDDIKEGEIYG